MSNRQNIPLRSVLFEDRLKRYNFIRWFDNLEKVLKSENKAYVLTTPIPSPPHQNFTILRKSWLSHVTDAMDVKTLMLATMEDEISQKVHQLSVYDMVIALRDDFNQYRELERYNVIRSLEKLKMVKGQGLREHFKSVKMHLEYLANFPPLLSQELIITIVIETLIHPYNKYVRDSEVDLESITLDELQVLLEVSHMDESKRYLFNYRSHLSYKV